MPTQTTQTANIYFPDGAKVEVKASGDSVFTDIGAISSSVNSTLNWVENRVVTANAGALNTQIQDMTMDLDFTLINLNQTAIAKLSGGLLTNTTTAASPTTDIPDQEIAAGWADQTLYDLVMYTSASDSTYLRTASAPTLTSVTLDPTGTPEVLVEGTEYNIVANPNSVSGWSISFVSSAMSTVSPTTYEIEIDYGSNTPIASTTSNGGTSSIELSASEIQITHTDSNSLIRRLNIYAAYPNSGGFQFNFKGANEDGTEEMPVSIRGEVDTSRTDGQQLFSWTVDNGAA
jgi:hypothetical protein